jgi:hypothetical protein
MMRGYGYGQDNGGFTLTVEPNQPKKEPNWMPIVVFGGVAALMYLWWRPYL